uniref:Uncharacterized protein n=1 Tax=Anguilla anguilla TaxID=7936 RepID=A0A0E9QW24_ANGAN
MFSPGQVLATPVVAKAVGRTRGGDTVRAEGLRHSTGCVCVGRGRGLLTEFTVNKKGP